MPRLLMPILVLVLFAAAPARADSFDDAAAAYKKGDYVTAVQLFQRFAEQGYAEAQIRLGTMHYNGQGVDDTADGAPDLNNTADGAPDLANDPAAIEALVKGIAGLLAARVDSDRQSWQQSGR